MDGGRKEQLGQGGGHLLLAVGVAGGGRREHLGQDGHLLLAPDQTRNVIFQVPAQQPVELDHVHQLQGEVCGNGDDLLLYLYMPP